MRSLEEKKLELTHLVLVTHEEYVPKKLKDIFEEGTNSDWANGLSESQLSLIDNRRKDIEENSVILHSETKKIKEYMQSKSS